MKFPILTILMNTHSLYPVIQSIEKIFSQALWRAFWLEGRASFLSVQKAVKTVLHGASRASRHFCRGA